MTEPPTTSIPIGRLPTAERGPLVALVEADQAPPAVATRLVAEGLS